MTRRAGLRLQRASARIGQDTWDDLWPDIANLIDLPRSGNEYAEQRKRIRAIRLSGARPAIAGPIPKADGLTRPGHYLWPPERTYYQALVDSVLHAIDAKFGGRGNIFGYREINGPNSTNPFGKPLDQWFAFRQFVKAAALSGNYDAVARTDIASFFERIDHQRLERQLRGLGVRPEVAAEIRHLLGKLMGTGMGLPQGSDPSSVLASAYLEPIDTYMLRKGYAFFRYVDDMYVFASSEALARVALRDLEGQLRLLQLNLQSGKTDIVVGSRAIRSQVVDADSDVASIAWVYRRSAKGAGLARIKTRWRSVARRKPFPARLGRYLLRRLAANKDPIAVNWCVRNLGILDWMSREVGPYLSLFPDSAVVQRGIVAHLNSPMNNSAAEESSLLRVLLSAKRVRRDALDHAVSLLMDKNAHAPSRQWACVLLGRHGDASDHRLIVARFLDDEQVARASAIASQGLGSADRGVVLSGIESRFPDLRPLTRRVRSLAVSQWPTYRA